MRLKVMFIVYHDIRTEARSQEILEAAKALGDETIFVSYSQPFDTDGFKHITIGKGKRRYFSFIKGAIQTIEEQKPDVVILHDNYTSIILRWIIKHRKKIYVIYDSSELYIDRKEKSFKLLIASHMRYFERKYLKYSNIVIAANIERATIMKDYFKLKETPIIFDNVHRIDDSFDKNILNKKYAGLFNENKFNILYGGGISKARMTFELVEAVGELGENYHLIICGRNDIKDKQELDILIEEKGFTNIDYTGFVPRNELRYLLKESHISVSAFAQDTVNNINCASGKLFESLFEGTPILTSENPPLKRICEKYEVGISNNNFKEGILELQKNYTEYSENVRLYIEAIDYDNRVNNLVDKLRKRIINN